MLLLTFSFLSHPDSRHLSTYWIFWNFLLLPFCSWKSKKFLIPVRGPQIYKLFTGLSDIILRFFSAKFYFYDWNSSFSVPIAIFYVVSLAASMDGQLEDLAWRAIHVQVKLGLCLQLAWSEITKSIITKWLITKSKSVCCWLKRKTAIRLTTRDNENRKCWTAPFGAGFVLWPSILSTDNRTASLAVSAINF